MSMCIQLKEKIKSNGTSEGAKGGKSDRFLVDKIVISLRFPK